MNILLATTGRIDNVGTKLLAMELVKAKHNVWVVGLAKDMSAKGMAFSYSHRPVKGEKVKYEVFVDKVKKQLFAYMVKGTPADSISLVLNHLVKEPIDLVICGPNNGTHLGQNIYTSSNCGMAREATFLGKKAIAIAAPNNRRDASLEYYSLAIRFIMKNLNTIANLKLPHHTFLNINMPRVEKYEDIKGVVITKQGSYDNIKKFERKIDPKGTEYFWTIYDPSSEYSTEHDDDILNYKNKYVTITATTYFLQDEEFIQKQQAQLTHKKGVGA